MLLSESCLIQKDDELLLLLLLLIIFVQGSSIKDICKDTVKISTPPPCPLLSALGHTLSPAEQTSFMDDP